MRWAISEPTLRNNPAASLGVCATASVHCDSATHSAPAPLLLPSTQQRSFLATPTLTTMASTLAFEQEPFEEDDSVFTVVPVIDGKRLTDLRHRFERDAGMEKRDTSYAGLISAFFRFGTADEHYLSTDKKIPILGCECGEWGCWPLMARIDADDQRVVWTDFEQPHRSRRDYSAFGPFHFKTMGLGRSSPGPRVSWGPLSGAVRDPAAPASLRHWSHARLRGF